MDLSDDENIRSEFISYFENSYNGTVRGRDLRRQKETLQLPIQLWIILCHVLNYFPGANDSVEGFYNALQSSITTTRHD